MSFSAHKIYAPFGLGVLVLPKSMLDSMPVDPGGGSIDMISDRAVTWAPPGSRHQSGTWNAAGIVALGASCEAIRTAGWSAILEHERELVRYAVSRLAKIDHLTLHVPAALYAEQDRIGAFPFSLSGYHSALLAAILEHEHALEVRAGTICNHALVRRWFNISDEEQARIEKEIAAGDRLASYGIVRASLGIHNTKSDVDALADALVAVRDRGPKLRYTPVPSEEAHEVALSPA